MQFLNRLSDVIVIAVGDLRHRFPQQLLERRLSGFAGMNQRIGQAIAPSYG